MGGMKKEALRNIADHMGMKINDVIAKIADPEQLPKFQAELARLNPNLRRYRTCRV